MIDKDKRISSDEAVDIGRRKALRRLGLAAGAAYAAPIMLNLSSAQASSGGGSGGDGGSGGGGNGGSGGGGERRHDRRHHWL